MASSHPYRGCCCDMILVYLAAAPSIPSHGAELTDVCHITPRVGTFNVSCFSFLIYASNLLSKWKLLPWVFLFYSHRPICGGNCFQTKWLKSGFYCYNYMSSYYADLIPFASSPRLQQMMVMENMLLYYTLKFQFPVLETHMSHVFPFGKRPRSGELLPCPCANEYFLSLDPGIITV